MYPADTLTRAPAVLPSYLRAIRAALGSNGNALQPGDSVPRSQLTLEGVSLRTPRLERYRALCGFAGKRVPPTWPQVLAFPLHMRLMTAPGFPIPLPGLVHVRNEIHVHSPLPADATVDLVARVGASRDVDLGTEFDLEVDMLDREEKIWSAVAITLFKQRGAHKRQRRPSREAEFIDQETHSVASNIGRRYARVSGDYNPIHLFAATARLLGFKRAIAHGMWTLAGSLARVDEPYADAPRRIECAFKTPVLLPAEVRLGWHAGQDACRFRLEDAKRGRPHVEGLVRLA